MITLLHNTNCSKSNCALDYTKLFSNIPIQIRDYIAAPLSKEELITLIKNLKVDPQLLIRKNEKAFIEHYQNENLDTDSIIRILINDPQLMERPILITDDTTIIGRPPELINEYLKNI